MAKWKRVLLWCGGFAVLLIAYAWSFGLQTACVWETRWLARKSPFVNNTPATLPDATISNEPGRKLSYLGYEFEAPWQDLDEGKSKIIRNLPVAVIAFHAHNSILLSVVPPRDFVDTISKATPTYPMIFRRMYGDQVLQSDYALLKAVYNATPRKITLFSSRQDAVGLSMILIVKAIIAPTADSEIYSIRSKDFQGFQLGNPSHRPARIEIKLFGEDVHLEFSIQQKANDVAPSITQAELNRIIQTVHKASAEPEQSKH